MSTHIRFSDAIENGNVGSAAALIDEQPELVDHPDWVPPPLHCAVLWDQPEIGELLLDRGADIERRDSDQNTTPLRYAILYCRPRMIALLLSRGANAGSISVGGTTALQLARAAAAGDYAQYEDLPLPAEYVSVVELLERFGVN